MSFSELLTYQEPDYRLSLIHSEDLPFRRSCCARLLFAHVCIGVVLHYAPSISTSVLFTMNMICSCFSLVSTGGKCLAKYSDGLWYQAIIR